MTAIDATRLEELTLARGGHERPGKGLCLMEAVAYVRGIPHTDQPPCVSPVLGAMGRSLNDVLPDDLRQMLIPLIPHLPGTAGDGHDEKRSYMALDWLVRTWLPAWLDLSPACREGAARVRELDQIVDLASAERAEPVVRQVGNAARDAAQAVTRAVARDAARDAARAVARDAAGDAAGDAARAAAWAAAWDAAEAAVWDAAWAAAGDASWAAAWAAAGDAARDALASTTERLQRSAIELYGRMTSVGTPS